MGRHSPPIDGTVTANGHGLAPFTVPAAMSPHGPVSVLPRQPARTAPWHDIDGDTAIRVLAAAVVLAVAAFAAIVSYSHIFELGRHHGQDGTAARLLPLSVDGLIAAASLVMLHAARRSQQVPVLARAMLALGVAATIAANIFYGLPFGWLAAVVSAWPAVAFVGSVEMAVRFVRDARGDDTTDDGRARPDSQVRAAATEPGWPGSASPHSPPPPRPGKGDKRGDKPAAIPPRKPAVTQKAKAAAAIRDNPGMTNAELARRAGVDVRTVQRARNSKPGSTA